MFIVSGVLGMNHRCVVFLAHRGVFRRRLRVQFVPGGRISRSRYRLSSAMIHRRMIAPADAWVTGV